MNLTILVFTILGLFDFHNKVSLEDNNLQLLAGITQKTWYLHSKTPDAVLPSCQANSPQSLDNSWIFFANGTFEFNRGAITQDNSCQDTGCCSDMLNIVGTWAFTNNGSGLKITMLHQKEKPSNSFHEVLLEATLIQLAADKFVVKVMPANGSDMEAEFRTK